MVYTNKIFLSGNLGKAPEKLSFVNGGSLWKFSLAYNRAYKDKSGEFKKITTWIECRANGTVSTNRILEAVEAGSNLYVEGRLVNESFTSKDGIAVNKTLVEIDRFAPIMGVFNKVEQELNPSVPYTREQSEQYRKTLEEEPDSIDEMPF